MPGRKKRTNFFLLLAMAALCFCCGYFFQQSTENPARIQEGRMELFAAKEGRKKRTNFFLLLAMAALCFCCGYFFQQSTENPARIQEGRMELFAAKDTDDPDKEQPVDLKEEPEITKPPAAQVSPTAVPVVFEVSPEQEQEYGLPAEVTGCFL